jgi:hypothetical protein
MILLYPDVVFHLNDVMFSVKGDGLKNYFNFMYHIKHDESYSAFDGMSYPYGETLVMVDLHPALSTFLKFFSSYLFDVSPFSVGIINGLMVVSPILSAIFLFLILDSYSVDRVLAIPAAIAISFLSSQPLLWEAGHYALSYSFFFPLSWYLIIRAYQSDKVWLYSFFILLVTLIWFYTHNYLGLIIVGFNFGVLLFSLFMKERKKGRTLLEIMLQVVLPVSIVFAVLKLSDNHAGRLDMHFRGEYAAAFQTVFAPNFSFTKPFYEWFVDLSPKPELTWADIGTYIGMGTNLTLVGMIIFGLYHLLNRRRTDVLQIFKPSEWCVIFSSLALLLFSMAIPMNYLPESWLPQLMKQFIGLGRFGWAFYYVSTVIAVLFLFRVFNLRFASIFILAFSALSFAEGMGYHIHLNKAINQNRNIIKDFEQSNSMQYFSERIDFKDYQAIIPLPFYHKYITPTKLYGSHKSEKISMALSYSTGLPLMSAILSRPSVLESKKVMQIFSPWYYQKSLHEDLSHKPLLLVYTKEELAEIEQSLLAKGEVILETEEFNCLRLSVEKLHKGSDDMVSEFLSKRENLYFNERSGYYYSDSVKFIYEAFDDLKSPVSKRGEGALTLDRNNLTNIFHSQGGELKPKREYTFSFWYYNYIFDQSFTGLSFHLKDSSGNIYDTKYPTDPISTPLYEGYWAYNEFDFVLENSSDVFELAISAVDLYADSLYVDEVLIFPKGQKLFKPVQNTSGKMEELIINNESMKILD